MVLVIQRVNYVRLMISFRYVEIIFKHEIKRRVIVIFVTNGKKKKKNTFKYLDFFG